MMLQISFKKNRSPRFREALSIALSLGATYRDEVVRLSVRPSKAMTAYEDLFPLLEIVGKWKDFSGTYKGKTVNPYRFIFNQYHNLSRCFMERLYSRDMNHCSIELDREGWGCRMLDSILFDLTGPGVYDRSGRYWYNYGRFNGMGEWEVDKDEIYRRLVKIIDTKGLELCPFFSLDKVKEKVFRDLPDIILPDNYNYRLFYQVDYENGRKILRAVNIRHVGDISEAPGLIRARLMYKIRSAFEFFKAHPVDVSPELKKKLEESIHDLTDVEIMDMIEAFDKHGNCLN